jgi:hypothetical protein
LALGKPRHLAVKSCEEWIAAASPAMMCGYVGSIERGLT